MRSMVAKKTGFAFVAILSLSLAACAPSAPEEFDSSNVPCAEVSLATEAASSTLTELQTSLEEVAGTPAEVSVQAEIDAAQAELSALEERSQECNEEPTADTAADTDCAPEFVQVAIDRESTPKVDPRYEGAVRPILNDSSLSQEEKADAIIDVELALSGSNAQTLATWAQGAGLYDDANDWPELVEGGAIVDGTCLTETGKLLWASYKGAITASGVTISTEEAAPSNGTNSGINGDTTVVHPAPGITGDRSAVTITLADGTKLIKMVRCGNVVWITIPPSLPPGETDEKKPSEDVGANPDVDEFYQDGQNPSEHHTISNEDGSTVANGDQGTEADVEADRLEAEAEAQAEADRLEAERLEAEAEANQDGGGIVNDTDDKTEASPPPWG